MVRIEPDPEQLPCQGERIKFHCEIMIPTSTLYWTLPSDKILEFGIQKKVGDVRNSSDNVYSATLTGKTEDDDPNTERFLFMSTLVILVANNGSNLTCSGAGTDTVKSTTISLSGQLKTIASLSVSVCLFLFFFTLSSYEAANELYEQHQRQNEKAIMFLVMSSL